MSCSIRTQHRCYQDYALVLLVFLMVWATRKWQGSSLIISDGFYYVTIARNVVEGLGFTYDTIHTTNGFHWMWMLILLVVCSIGRFFVQLDSVQLIEGVFALNCFIWAWSALAFYRVLQLLRIEFCPKFMLLFLTAIVFIDPVLTQNAINGLETALFLLLLLLLNRAYIERRVWACALLFQLLVFTRIEGLAVLPILLYGFRHSFRASAFAALLIPFGAILTFVLNFIVDDSVLSSSSLAKAYWAARARGEFFWPLGLKEQAILVIKDAIYLPCSYLSNILFIFDNASLTNLAALAIVVVMIIAGSWRSAVHISLEELKISTAKILPFVFFCLVSYLVYKIYYFTPRSAAFKDIFPVTDYQSRYYFAPHLVLLLTAIHLTLLKCFRSYLPGFFSLLALTAFSWGVFIKAHSSGKATDSSSPACIPAPAALYAAGNDDGFAYYHRVPLVVLDGLVTGHRMENGWRYLDSMKSKTVESYISELRIQYIRLGSEKHLNFMAASSSNERLLAAGRVVSLCGMGQWLEVKRDSAHVS